MSVRLARLREQFKVEISAILQREMKDPRIGFVSITDVELSHDLRHANRVERQVETGTDADFEHPTPGSWNDPAAIGCEPALAHRRVDQPREDTVPINPHDASAWSGLIS